jgi:glycine/D-amino acid oxidase-like deaminating enzyme
MSAVWGEPPWRVQVAIPAMPPPTHVDVAVIGAGLAGLATAWELARRGAGVTVFEAERVGAGASGHSGAIALEGTAIGPLEDADDCLGSLARIARDAELACDLRLDGCWEVTHGPAAGEPLWRDGDATLAVAGEVPGGTLDPGAALAGLARVVLAAGGQICERSRVDRLDVGSRRVLRVRDAEVTAERVVVATNAYLPTLLSLPIDLRPALTLAVATAPLDQQALTAVGLAERRPFYTVDLPYLWGRVLADGRGVFGSGLVFPGDRDVRAVHAQSPEAREAFARLETRVRGLHPALATVPIAHRWGGPIAFVPGRAPVLATHPADPNVVVTGGCSGHGIALSFRLGELIALHLTAGRRMPAWGAL